ncbi:MAG: RluA family pseudouridine synthase [Oscillibacter sp.]|jgi:23S rRNA pseudouridine1911/1915/1917 synthase|nr:RluA family pseudouridine synthase [Oscillibacter sp.]
MQILTLTVSPSDDGKTVRGVLREKLGFSYHAVASLTRTEGGILLNGRRAYASAAVRAGDALQVEAGDRRPPKSDILPCGTPVEILFQDEWLVIINKPAGMASLFSRSHPDKPSVPGALAFQYGPDVPFHIVNRLDKGTTGLMVAAKCGYVHHLLMEQLHSPDFFREYRGICLGCPQPERGTIDLPIGRDERSIVARMIRPDGAPSVTHYEVLEKGARLSLLRLLPETGRTHQLRLHMAAVGHPLAGDWLYGTENPALIARPALHSFRLVLRHPVTGERLELTAPLPEDMARLMQR